jgi:putative transposase
VPVARLRMRAVDGSGELPVASEELFSQTEVLGRMAMERMLARLSTRRYPVGLEPVGAATETALAELLAADLSSLDLVALMVDGVYFGEHCCVVALGIDIDGVKHPLALVEGSTENATLVTELLVSLRERARTTCRCRKCPSQRAQSHQQCRLMITGPPPKSTSFGTSSLHLRLTQQRPAIVPCFRLVTCCAS